MSDNDGFVYIGETDCSGCRLVDYSGEHKSCIMTDIVIEDDIKAQRRNKYCPATRRYWLVKLYLQRRGIDLDKLLNGGKA